MTPEKSLIKRISHLAVSIGLIWLLTFQILPFITSISPATRQMAAFIDESGIETGQFFYTGVEIVSHAEAGARSSVYFSHQHEIETD